MKYLAELVLCLFISFVASHRHIDASGAFGKRHLIDEIGHSYIHNYTANVSTFKDNPMILNVSSTVYSNTEQINVTWTSTSISCKDDFIGIYSIEIPISTGMEIFKNSKT